MSASEAYLTEARGPGGEWLHGAATAVASPSEHGHPLSAASHAALVPHLTYAQKDLQAATVKQMERDGPDAQDVVRLARTLQNGPASAIPRTRTDVEKLVNGEPLPEGRAKAIGNLLGAIADSDVGSRKLYRGMTIPGSPEEVAAQYQPGSAVHISLGSFTSDRAIASNFAHGKVAAGQRSRGGKKTPVILKWEDGPKRALPLQNLADVRKVALEREYLSSGEFQVTSVHSAAGGVTVGVRQVKPL